MKTTKTIVTITSIAVCSLMILPFSAFAQYSGHDGEYFGNDNVNNWRNQNNVIQQNINLLGTTAITDLPIPVLFSIAQKNLTRNFEEVRSNGHTHEGLDIMSPEGMPVVSPTAAVVVHVAVGASAGNYVSTANPGGETFVYMHLSKVANIQEGAVLKEGDLIGYVGHTGNAIATAPHLHFEIHNPNGDATDPYPRLTTVFSIDKKITFLQSVLNVADDKKAVANLIVNKARSEVQAAQTQNITLPLELSQALVDNPVSISPTISTSISSAGTLKVGSKGTEVMTLQAYLVSKRIGTGSAIVADGSFGPKTKQALVDFQGSVGLTADGVYGPKSKAYVIAHQ